MNGDKAGSVIPAVAALILAPDAPLLGELGIADANLAMLGKVKQLRTKTERGSAQLRWTN